MEESYLIVLQDGDLEHDNNTSKYALLAVFTLEDSRLKIQQRYGSLDLCK